ncbi:MAG TPA: methylornithine synthase PylB, partial [Firmicutes bacterium]|nr:methylornithine synthase PylB [Bacillota bacterium]
MKNNSFTLENLTEKALENNPLSAVELRYLLNIEDEDKIELLKDGARRIRSHFFGDVVFLYGFLYFSTYCRNYCSFCNFSANNSMDRYRKTRDDILKISEGLAASGVNLLDLTMGEDPFYLNNNGKVLEETVNDVLQLTNLPLMVSPGVVEAGLLRKFARLGVSWYACYQETYSPSLFKK